MPYTNPHLSYSRLTRFEQCPLSFKLHYIDELPSEPGPELRFGKCIHRVLETLVRRACEPVPFTIDEGHGVALFREAWNQEGLLGFGEGLDIMRRFVRDSADFNPRTILGIEKEFEVQVGKYKIVGAIDRIDQVDDETLEIIDYKTNRQIFTRDELGTSLQLSLYELAARQMFPWAKTVKLTYWMLRHGIRLTTTRTAKQLADAQQYVTTLADRIEASGEFPAKLNTNCVHCDHQGQCPTFAEARAGKRFLVAESLDNLDQVARERQEVAALAKILDARKSELEDVIKEKLKEKDPLVAGGVRFSMSKVTKVDYPLDATILTLRKATGMTRDKLLERIAVVSKDALDKLTESLDLPKRETGVLRGRLEKAATRSYFRRLTAHEVRS